MTGRVGHLFCPGNNSKGYFIWFLILLPFLLTYLVIVAMYFMGSNIVIFQGSGRNKGWGGKTGDLGETRLRRTPTVGLLLIILTVLTERCRALRVVVMTCLLEPRSVQSMGIVVYVIF